MVSPSEIAIADWDWDLAYMGVYLRLEICNRSRYLVREATLRIEGQGRGGLGVVTSRLVHMGPLFPGVRVHEEVGVSAQGGIGGIGIETLAAHAVGLTPPALLMPAHEYTGLVAEIAEVACGGEVPDLRVPAGGGAMTSGKSIRVRVRNDGPLTVHRTRIRLRYFDVADDGDESPDSPSLRQVAEWHLDVPARDWNPHCLSGQPRAVCTPAPPLPPGGTYAFTLVHYGGGPHEWAGTSGSTRVDVLGVRVDR